MSFAFRYQLNFHMWTWLLPGFSSSVTLLIMDSWNLQASATRQVARICSGSAPPFSLQPVWLPVREGASRWGTAAVTVRIPVAAWRKEVAYWMMMVKPRCPQGALVVLMETMLWGETALYLFCLFVLIWSLIFSYLVLLLFGHITSGGKSSIVL